LNLYSIESFNTAANFEKISKREAETPVIKIDSIYRGLDYLVELVKHIRPSRATNYKEAQLKFKALLYQLQNDKKALFSLRKALLSQLLICNFVPALTESGMPGSRGFLQELIKKIKHRLLPPLLEPEIFYMLSTMFSIGKMIISGLKRLTGIFGLIFLTCWAFR
jgi:site-specific recombinase